MITILNVKRMNVKFGKNLYRQINTRKKASTEGPFSNPERPILIYISEFVCSCIKVFVFITGFTYLLIFDHFKCKKYCFLHK